MVAKISERLHFKSESRRNGTVFVCLHLRENFAVLDLVLENVTEAVVDNFREIADYKILCLLLAAATAASAAGIGIAVIAATVISRIAPWIGEAALTSLATDG